MTDCYLCGRNVEVDLTVRVDFGGAFIGIVDVCHECYVRGEEAADVADPITEDVA